MKNVFLIVMLIATLLKAGDPCPILIDIYDDGIPSWAKKSDIYKGLKLEHPHMGIWIDDVNEDEEVYLEDGVSKNSPASKAGLKEGDTIVALAGKKIKNYRDLLNILVKQNPIYPQLSL